MTARVRFAIYITAIVAGLVCAGLALAGVVKPEQAQTAVVVLGIVYSGVSGLAAKNVNK